MAQPSLWGNALDSFQNAVGNPLTLGGLSLLSGGDVGSGVAAGTAIQRQRQAQQQQEALKASIFNLPGLNDADKQVLGSSPEIAIGVLSKRLADRYDPMAKLRVQEAQGNLDMQPLRRQALQAQITGSQNENALRGKSWGVTGRDAYGQPTYGVVDLSQPNAGLPQAAPGQTDQPLIAPPNGLSGDAFLKTLQPQEANEIKALAEGRMPIPGGFALKSPYWQRKMSQLSQYDPNFDTVNYNARAATRKDFTSGKSAQNITSFNTAIGHLDHLSHAIDGLNNSDYTAVNRANNATAGVNADRAKKLAAFNTARNAVVEELTRAFKGTGGSLTEVQEWEKLIDPNASPPALKQMVKTATDLLASRIDSVGEQYNKGMGTTSDPLKLLTPKAQQLWQKLNPQADGSSPVAAPVRSSPRATVPSIGEVRDGFRYRGGNPGDPKSWEGVR